MSDPSQGREGGVPVRRVGDFLPSILRVSAAGPAPVPEPPAFRDRWLSEVNYQRLPLATLWDKRAGSMDHIVVTESDLRAGTAFRRRWEVIPGEGFGLPGPTAYATFRALEKIVLGRTLARGLPLSCPQSFEIQEICRELDLAVHSDNYETIKTDLRRIAHARFVDVNFLRQKRAPGARARPARETQKSSHFSLISRVVFAREAFDGKLAQTNAVWFDPLYVASVNAGYVKPLDWGLWKSLSRPIARRLYELLDLHLFAKPAALVLEFDYERLAQLLPVKPAKYLAHAKVVMDPALGLLKRHDVIADWSWTADGSVWWLRMAPANVYRARLEERARPTFDPRAIDLARELGDYASLALFQKIVTSVDFDLVHRALSQTKLAVHFGAQPVAKPGAYFTETLAALLKQVGHAMPFNTSG
ncbi:MAG: replication initiator protein A [Planctomycetes bacterium]|nr:replication initiator protein A [Planctomycetota bacterium]